MFGVLSYNPAIGFCYLHSQLFSCMSSTRRFLCFGFPPTQKGSSSSRFFFPPFPEKNGRQLLRIPVTLRHLQLVEAQFWGNPELEPRRTRRAPRARRMCGSVDLALLGNAAKKNPKGTPTENTQKEHREGLPTYKGNWDLGMFMWVKHAVGIVL